MDCEKCDRPVTVTAEMPVMTVLICPRGARSLIHLDIMSREESSSTAARVSHSDGVPTGVPCYECGAPDGNV